MLGKVMSKSFFPQRDTAMGICDKLSENVMGG
jgi:hypothetical protein